MKATRIIALTCLFAAANACSGSPPPAPVPPPPTELAASEPAAAAPTGGAPAGGAKAAPGISKSDFGTVDGKEVQLYTLTNANGLSLKVTNYGTIITEFHVPDRDGKFADIVLGYDNLAGYVKATPYFGATAGRVANRIKNARFELKGKTYKLAANNGPHNLHGGLKGWDKVVWDAAATESPDGPTIEFTYVSKDGEEGFPGTVTAKTRYTLSNANELKVDMSATTDKTTIVNMAHHTYWNLGGYASGPILDQELMIHADQYTPSAPVENGDPVPDGTIKPVKGTPFDFTVAKTIGKDLQAAGGKPVGFDHNWIVNGTPGTMRPAARVKDPKSGRVLLVETAEPGVQFYSGKFLDGSITGKGATYAQYTGFCIETQRFPNAINVPAWRRQVILEPGQTYEHSMIHRLSIE
jgi:aldose 1-epimerase